MTQHDFIIRYKYDKKAFKKSRWKRAKERLLNRDPEWRRSIAEIERWIDECEP